MRADATVDVRSLLSLLFIRESSRALGILSAIV
jgi:hypothetical protein